MTEVRGNGGLIDTGIRGVEKVVLAVPEDSYRVVLLTRGPSRGAIEPFARAVRVNGVSFHITRRASERWISAAILPANDVLRPATRAVETAAGDFAFVHRSRGASENGGAMVLGAHATAGRLTVELGPGTSVRTFVSGMLVERADLPSDLVLGGDAPRHVGPLSDRVGFEQQIAATARRVLERAAAAAARRSVYDLPRPALRPRRG